MLRTTRSIEQLNLDVDMKLKKFRVSISESARNMPRASTMMGNKESRNNNGIKK